MASKKKIPGYKLKIYWDDGSTVECRYFHNDNNADKYGSHCGYDYDVEPLLEHETSMVKRWED